VSASLNDNGAKSARSLTTDATIPQKAPPGDYRQALSRCTLPRLETAVAEAAAAKGERLETRSAIAAERTRRDVGGSGASIDCGVENRRARRTSVGCGLAAMAGMRCVVSL
jgi:hypothetical protein